MKEISIGYASEEVEITSEIPELMTKQDEEIDYLTSLVRELQGRLISVLRSEAEEESKIGVNEKARSELGQHIEDNNMAITRQSAAIQSLLKRMEL